MRRIFIVSFLALSAAALHAGPTTAVVQRYRVDKGHVVVTCPLTVGGSFEAKTEAIVGELLLDADGKVTGALSVDLTKLETGIGLRDQHLQLNYLEVHKEPGFDRAVIEAVQIDRLNGSTGFTATVLVHGQRQQITGSAKVRDDAGMTRVEAEFPLRISHFKIPEPAYLGVGVRDEIRVRVSFVAARGAASGQL